jgi:hypothetical protein
MYSLNIQFLDKEENEKNDKMQTPEFFNTKDIGDIGEASFQLECLKKGITVAKVVGDNKPYEFIMDLNNNFYKIQVKTTYSTNGNGISIFRTTSTVRVKNKYVANVYIKEMIDYFYLYNVELDKGFLIEPNGQKTIRIRHENSLNNQIKNINFEEDYLFENIIEKLIN